MWSEWSVIRLVPCCLLHLSKRTWITFPTSPFLFSMYRKWIWLSFLCRMKPMVLYRVNEWAINGISVSSFFIREIHFSPQHWSRRVAKQLELKKKYTKTSKQRNSFMWRSLPLCSLCLLLADQFWNRVRVFLSLWLFLGSWNLIQSLVPNSHPLTAFKGWKYKTLFVDWE